MTERKYMTLKEFRDKGLLQEVNRLFMHPHGLAFQVTVDKETGEVTDLKIWDDRDDPEGVVFGDGLEGKQELAESTRQERLHRVRARANMLHPDLKWLLHELPDESLVRSDFDIEPLEWVWEES